MGDNWHSRTAKYVEERTFGPADGPHGHPPEPKDFPKTQDIARLAGEIPPPLARNTSETVKIALTAREVVSEVAPGISYLYWTFDGTTPGPFLRVREGDTVELTLSNAAGNAHNNSIDLHAVTGPGGGATLTQVEPGQRKTLRFTALNPGLYEYHCATPNVPTHIANGMYGLILVEPTGGLPRVDREYYVMQGELYTAGELGEDGYQAFSAEKMLREQPEYMVFNGRVKALADRPLRAITNETVRLYVGNGGISRSSAFHVIGEIFDVVYPEGGTTINRNVQTTTVPPGGAAMVEFRTEVPGTYVLVDHALARLDRGAWGLLEVQGKENSQVYGEKQERDAWR